MPWATETTQASGNGGWHLAKDFGFIPREMESHSDVLMGRVLTWHF